MSDRHKQLMEKALSCIQLARAIKDRYPDPTQMGSDDLENMRKLTQEGIRLKGLAEAELEHAALEDWAHQPDGPHPALAADAAARAAQVRIGNGGAGAGAGDDMVIDSKMAIQRFAKALRVGAQGLSLEEKAALVENTTGEIIVPHDVAGPIFKTLPRLGIIRNAGPFIRPTSSNKVDIRSLTNPAAGWGKLEVGATPPTDANIQPAGPDVIEVHDLLTLAKIGEDELEDTDVNLVAVVQEVVGRKFAEMEDDAFANGNGTSKPWGLAMRASQASPLITQAVTAAANATITSDDLKKLAYRVPAIFRAGGAYFASGDATEGIALLKDSTGQYLWQPSNQVGQPDVLFGKRFYTVEGLPLMTSSAAAVDPSVLFGDISAGYAVADRRRITFRRLDERYADEGQVGFLFKQRVGGDVIRPAAWAKLLL